MADAVVVTILSNLCITAVSIMKTTGGLLLLCVVAHLCSCSGELRVDSALNSHKLVL